MRTKEKYNKAIANVILYDVSDPIVTFSNECEGATWSKHDPDCSQVYSTHCGECWYPDAYKEGH